MLKILILLFKIGFQLMGSALFPFVTFILLCSTYPVSLKRLPEHQQMTMQFVGICALLSVVLSRFRPSHAPYSVASILTFVGCREAITRYGVQTEQAVSMELIASAVLYYVIATKLTMYPLNFVIALVRNALPKSKTHKVKGIDQAGFNEERGRAFEEYVASLFRTHYGNAKTTAAMKEDGELPNIAGDKGVDVIFYRTLPLKAPMKVLVQCKYYTGKVGIEAVQQIVAAKAFYKGQDLMVVTNSTLTQAAMELAIANCVQVLQGSDLKELEARV